MDLTFTDDIPTVTDYANAIVRAIMPVPWLTAYRALLLLSFVVGLFLLYQAAMHRDRPGAKPLFVLVTGALLYVSVKLTVSIVRGTPTVFVVTRFNPLGAGLATVGFFLLVIEYTGIENPVSKRTSTGVVLVPAVVSALAVIDLEYLWVPVGPDSSTLSGYAWEFTSVALANQLYMNLLLFAGIGLLVRRGIQSPTVFRVQVGALILSALGPLVGNLAFQFGYVQFNLTPVMFMSSGVLIAWAILRTGFLDLIPIGRETVLDQFDASVVTLDKDHRVIDLNKRGRQLFDVDDADTVVGDHIDELFADHPTFRERYWTVTASDSRHEPPVEFDGSYYTVEVIPLGPPEETTLGRSIIIRDITEQKRREQELEETKRTLERSNEKLDQFAGMVSHDLRNPLNVIKGRAELLRGEAPDEHVETIENTADRMETMIDDLLTLSRAGESVDDPKPISLATVVSDSWVAVSSDDIELEVDLSDDGKVEADGDRLRHVFENLFRNASEHNEPPVTIRVGTLSDETGSVSGFFVADDGAGIPEPDRKEVFEHGYTTNTVGTGFGLSIVEEIVEGHGWTISVGESDAGGARFDVYTTGKS
ncbi:histidine kinase N-terminal 7TM domain-containing protein [Haloplanus salinarum]|uniref:histidine kinase N-terminal 7TM domain-containing protein n=2 Tax=Haloplanus salinarum TaxID=1912324 RepID=UPI00214BCA9B|nr:histidine kinase N-terminal 7TM domain-containing protein [Haloplanus salinarum]